MVQSALDTNPMRIFIYWRFTGDPFAFSDIAKKELINMIYAANTVALGALAAALRAFCPAWDKPLF
jgi:Pyruvate/2-oxoacid:ferredoxin oxidoreductase gamma subunit